MTGREAERERVRAVVARALPLIFAIGLVLNVGITVRFQSGTSHSLRVSDSPELADLIDSTYPEMRHTYGLYADLAPVAAGATLLLPQDHPLDVELARIFGSVRVEVAAFDPGTEREGLGTPVRGGTVMLGEELVPYLIFAGPEDSTYWMGRSEEGILVIPSSLRPAPAGST